MSSSQTDDLEMQANEFGAICIERNLCGTCHKDDVKVAVFEAEIRLCPDCLVDLANLITFADVPEAP